MARLNADSVRRVLRRPASAAALAELTARVDELEAQLSECRRQHLRVAELTDVVQELLLPLSQQDPQKAEAALRRYTDELG